jgi:membrane-associated PAP2 superfamily phosphatase
MTEFVQASPDTGAAARSEPVATGDFWTTHAWMPLALFLPLFLCIEWLGLDRVVAHALFFDAAADQWLGAGSGDWWAHRLIHDGGRWFARCIAATVLVLWLGSFVCADARPWRRTAGFVFLAMITSILVVGLLKTVTNVDCPWDLAEFGGDRPYVGLFADRTDSLSRAQCFPGAHSSSGFALVCFYFVFRDRSRRAARWALLAACLVWAVFSLGQQARGAHFLSHDLASLAIVWFVQLLLYARLMRGAGRHRRGRRAASGRRRRGLSGVLVAKEPENGAHHDARDTDAVADARSPVVHPAQNDELHVQEMEYERAGAHEHQESAETLHASPLYEGVVVIDPRATLRPSSLLGQASRTGEKNYRKSLASE